MSLSLHSSTECGGSMSRGSRNSRDIVSEKSLIGLISVRISSSPDRVPGSTEARHSSAPISHLNEAVCRARRSGTSRGSAMRAKEMRRGARDEGAGRLDDEVRDAAKCGPSEVLLCSTHERARRTTRDSSGTVSTTGAGTSAAHWRRHGAVEGQRKRAAYLTDRLLSRRRPGLRPDGRTIGIVTAGREDDGGTLLSQVGRVKRDSRRFSLAAG